MLDLVTEQLVNLAKAKTLCLEMSVDVKRREFVIFLTYSTLQFLQLTALCTVLPSLHIPVVSMFPW